MVTQHTDNRRKVVRKLYRSTVKLLLKAERDGDYVDGRAVRLHIYETMRQAGYGEEFSARLRQSLYQKALNFVEKVETQHLQHQVLQRVQAQHPGMDNTEIDRIVTAIMGAVSSPSREPRRPVALSARPSVAPEVKAVWDARRAERKRIVKANKLRRKAR